MRIIYIYIFILTILSFRGFSQGLYDSQEIFNLINSGKSKVIVHGKQHSIWLIDSVAKTISIHILVPSIMNPIGPKYDEQLSTGYFKKYFFNKLGNVDSILTVDYGIGVAPTDPFQVDTISDTAIIVYSSTFLESRVINRRYYKIKAGQRILLSTDYFGYDTQNRLILLLQDEGRVQFFYSYNQKGQIVKETIHNTTILYEYNKEGKLTTRNSETQKIKYEYSQNKLLIRKIVSGKDAETTTYTYE